MTVEQLQAELAKLTAENKALVAEQTRKAVFKLKVSEKGAVSIYGLNARFPVTLYRGQMERLLDHSDEIRAFIKANEAKLAVKVANGQTTEVVGGATTTIASAPAK